MARKHLNIGGKIQARRKAMGLSQEDLAQLTGVSRQSVTKWETGQSAPDLDRLTVVGLGVSNIVPVLFSATARQKFMPLSLAVSAVTTIGYLGVLAGPALMGFVAHATSLVIVFCITLALMCFVAVVSRAVP